MSPLSRRNRANRGTARRAFALLRSLWRPARRPGPFKLTLQVTDGCSLRCAICSLWKAPRPDPPLADLEALFAANPPITWLNLTGGEAFERSDFLGIAEAAVRSTDVALLNVPTAGQRPDDIEAKTRALLDLPFVRIGITVSLDGPREVHDRLRGRPGAFDRAVETLSRLRALGGRRLTVRAGLTLSSRNDADPERLVAGLLADAAILRPSDLHFNLAHHAPHYYRNRPQDGPDTERAAAFLERWARRPAAWLDPLAALERRYRRLARSYLATGRSPVPCTALAGSVFVDSALHLFPCIGWDLPIADLRRFDFSIERALARPIAAEARRAADEGRCPGCWTPCEAFPALLRLGPRPRPPARARRAAEAAPA